MKITIHGRAVKPIVTQFEGRTYQIEIRPLMTKVKRSGLPPITDTPEKRGSINGLSVASGNRFLDLMAAVDPVHGKPLVIELTYPSEFVGDWTRWKKDLDNWRRSMWDTFGAVLIGGVWRLEAQRRGAPHYHILLWSRFDLESKRTILSLREVVAEKWFRIVGSGDEKHLRAGTRVKACDDKRGGLEAAMRYLTKYVGKDATHPDSQVFNRSVGRYWGVWQKKALIVDPEVYQVGEKAYCQIRRTLSNIREKKIKSFRKRSGRSGQGHKEGYNSCPLKQLEKPGRKEFLNRRTALKLLDYFEPIPF